MQLKKGQIVELDIHALAFGGRGIGKHEGMSVFVDRTIPGDKVKAAFTRIKPKFGEARLEEILEKSKDRIAPKCPYAETCGGCPFQIMEYKKQLEFKKQHTIDAFERIGKIYNPPVEDVIPCKDIFYFRNKMEFSFGYNVNMEFALGMHVPGRRFDIMDLKECHLESEFSYKLVNAVRDFVMPHKWPPFKYSVGKGFLKSLYIREGKRTGEVMVNLVTSDAVPKDFESSMDEFVEILRGLDSDADANDDKKVTSIYWSQVIAKRGFPRRTKEKLLWGKRSLSEKLILENGDELDFEILPQAFFQVNTFQAEILYSEVVKLIEKEDYKMVFDLFCGTGTIGLFLAKHTKQVLGIELNEEAVKIARENAVKNNIFNIDFFAGDIGKVLGTVREKPDLIVVDPPRVGLNSEKVVKKLNDLGAKKIIYVSCNPATLARDCEWLGGYGYKVKSVQPVDMFPHSYHIENVCLLER